MAEKLIKSGGITVGLCTSGSKVKLSILAGGKFSSASRKSRNQEKVLFPMLDRLWGHLAARCPRYRGAGLKDISALCVITGPGRFTGLRVGLTLAGALKTLAGIRVYSSTLFEVLAGQAAASKEFKAWAAVRECPRVAALVHAFKDEYFCQVFEVRSQKSEVRSQKMDVVGYRCLPIEAPRWFKDIEVTQYLKGWGGDLYAVADSEEKTEIYSLVPAEFEKAPARISKIMPESVIRTGLSLRNRDLRPLYLKPAKYELA